MTILQRLAARPLIMRTAAFLVICLLYSGLIGPRIISGGILYDDGFAIYGGLGKAALFGAVAFGLLLRHARQPEAGAAAETGDSRFRMPAWKRWYSLWLAVSAAAFAAAWLAVGHLIGGGTYATAAPLAHLLLWTSLIAAALSTLGWPALRHVCRTYRRQLLLAAALAAGFYLFLLAVYAAWKPLAGIVLHAVRWLFGLTGLQAAVEAPRTLVFDKFSVEIAQYCSGIESIALFTGLYAIIAILDWDKLRHRALLAIFWPALGLLFVCNILRVYLIILLAYYWNPDIAFDLFHTYAGMVFFIIYSGVFWGLAYKRLLRVTSKKYSGD